MKADYTPLGAKCPVFDLTVVIGQTIKKKQAVALGYDLLLELRCPVLLSERDGIAVFLPTEQQLAVLRRDFLPLIGVHDVRDFKPHVADCLLF